MPQTNSAKKALRNSRRKQLRNYPLKTKLRLAVSGFKKKNTKENFKKAQGTIDRMISKGILPKRRGARLKSRLSSL